MKTLKFQIILVSALLLSLLATIVWLSMRQSFETHKLSEEYAIKNRIADHLNAAAGWQAIERGYGATILGSGKGQSFPLFQNFLEMTKKGDSEVLQAEKHIKKLTGIKHDKSFEEQMSKWQKCYEALLSARPRIAKNEISKEEWLNIATHNINREFDLRNATFTPRIIEERVLYLNNLLRPNIARLCEYAGRERALIGNAIASGGPFSNDTKKRIKEYRSIVKQCLGQVLLLNDLPATPDRTKKAIDTFEKEFLIQFQLLRQEVFATSKKQEDAIADSSVQIVEIKEGLRIFLSEISADLLNLSKHKNVITLADALMTEEDAHLSEDINDVESLFYTYLQVKTDYAQIRFLDSFGHERVRLDVDGIATKTVHGVQLQDKSSRYYFKESTNLSPGEIYISPIDLNVEHGRIEVPHKPVIRFATPVFVGGKHAGIIILKFMVSPPSFLHNVLSKEGREEHIIVDQDGFYIHHPNELKELGMITLFNRSHHNIKQDYPDAAEQILSGEEGSVLLASGKEIVFKPFFLNPDTNTGNPWIIINQVDRMAYPVDAPTWFDRATEAINTGLAISNVAGEEANAAMLEMESAAKRRVLISFSIFASAILLSLFFIWWSRNRILKPIQELTRTTQRIADGDYLSMAKVNSGNELGVLAVNFNKMTKVLTHEITDHKNTAKALKGSEESYRKLIDTAQDAIIRIDENGVVNIWNKMAEKIFGYSEREIMGQPITTIIPERFRKQHNEGMQRVLKTGSFRYVDQTMYVSGITKKGIEVSVEMSMAFQKSGVGRYSFTGIIRDITEKNKREHEIKMLSCAVEQNPCTVLITDTKGNIEYVNQKFTQLTGYTLEEVIGKLPSILRTDKTQPEVHKRMWDAITSGKEWQGEFYNKKKSGELYWESALISPVRDSEGTITNFVAVKEDITERKMAEDEIRKNISIIKLLQEIILSANDATNPADALTECIKKICTFTRWPVGHVYMTDSSARLKPANIWYIRESKKFKAFRRITQETFLECGEGLPGRVLLSGKPHWIIDVTKDANFPRAGVAVEVGIKAGFAFPVLEGEKTVAVLEFFSEESLAPDNAIMEAITHLAAQLGRVTERKRAEEQTQASLKEKEVLLKEIHHRVKNNMQIISSLLRLQSRYIKGEAVVDIFRDSLNRIQSMSQIHEQLYRSDNLARVNINQYIKSLIRNLQESYGNETSMVTISSEVEEIEMGIDTCVPCGLIINELIANSLQHAFPPDFVNGMPEGEKGEIKVRFSRTKTDEGIGEEKGYELVVKDNGIGIPEDKDIRKTDTLGLGLVADLAEGQLHGRIELKRCGGTEFRIRFNEIKSKSHII